jgi:hypothetical protein
MLVYKTFIKGDLLRFNIAVDLICLSIVLYYLLNSIPFLYEFLVDVVFNRCL